MTPNIIIGCDLGLSGGISFFDTLSKEVLGLYKMPTYEVEKSDKKKRVIDLDKLHFILEIPKVHNDSAVLVMENVHAFPGQGVVAVATLLEQKGLVIGLSKALGYDLHLVEPKTWQKFYELIPPKELKGKKASQTKTLRKKWLKQQSVIKSIELFPSWEEKIEKSDGLSDATLIGNWYLQTNTP